MSVYRGGYGCAGANCARGAADRGEYRQAAGAIAQAVITMESRADRARRREHFHERSIIQAADTSLRQAVSLSS